MIERQTKLKVIPPKNAKKCWGVYRVFSHYSKVIHPDYAYFYTDSIKKAQRWLRKTANRKGAEYVIARMGKTYSVEKEILNKETHTNNTYAMFMVDRGYDNAHKSWGYYHTYKGTIKGIDIKEANDKLSNQYQRSCFRLVKLKNNRIPTGNWATIRFGNQRTNFDIPYGTKKYILTKTPLEKIQPKTADLVLEAL